MLDVKGDKGLWFRYRLEYIGTALEVEESYYNGIIELIEKQQKEIEELLGFVRDCQTNWDCDSDAHRYNTPCRSCEAEKLLNKSIKKG